MAMVRKIWRMPLPALLLTLLVGCVNFSYQGEEFAPTENVSVFYSASEVPADFAVIGKARASGNYSEVTNDQLVDKLIEEAKSKGADGVLIKGIPRHPKLEDGVTVYAGATILGNITIGAGSVIGANTWVTRDEPRNSKVVSGD